MEVLTEDAGKITGGYVSPPQELRIERELERIRAGCELKKLFVLRVEESEEGGAHSVAVISARFMIVVTPVAVSATRMGIGDNRYGRHQHKRD